MHSVCVVKHHDGVNCTKILSVAEPCFGGNSNTYVSLHVKCPILHSDKRLFVCSWPSLDVQFGYTDLNDR
jgi:hypothetical protein